MNIHQILKIYYLNHAKQIIKDGQNYFELNKILNELSQNEQ
jgi:hypothetical protein